MSSVKWQISKKIELVIKTTNHFCIPNRCRFQPNAQKPLKESFAYCKIRLEGDDALKCEIIIDPLCEEKLVIYAKEKSVLVEEIKKLAEQSEAVLLGYKDSEIVKLNLIDVHCISVIKNKVYAFCDEEQYFLKERLYVLEERLPQSFVKINQSCLANIKKMERFDTSVSGTLKIHFKNGHTDYVSRRQLKVIKERLGI